MMKECPNCGELNPDGSFFCTSCRTKLSVPKPKANQSTDTNNQVLDTYAEKMKGVVEKEQKRKKAIILSRNIMGITALLILATITLFPFPKSLGFDNGVTTGCFIFSIVPALIAAAFFLFPAGTFNLHVRRRGVVRLISGDAEKYDEELDGLRLNIYMGIYLVVSLFFFVIGIIS